MAPSQLPCRENLRTGPRALPWSTLAAPAVIKTGAFYVRNGGKSNHFLDIRQIGPV